MIQISSNCFGTHSEVGPRGREMLDEAGGNVRVQDDVCLLRAYRVQSVRARLDWLYSGRDLGFERVQRAITVILCG